MEVLTQCSDPYDAAVKLADWGVKEVLLTLGDKGSLIYVDERFYEIPAYPVENVADATGCGDTYMAGYLYMRKEEHLIRKPVVLPLPCVPSNYRATVRSVERRKTYIA